MTARRPVAPRRPIARVPACRFLTGLLGALLVFAGCSTGSGGSSSAPTLHDVADLLARHGNAVLRHDRKAFLADVDGEHRSSKFRDEQGGEFDNLAKLPLTNWTYTIGSRTDDTSAEAAAKRRYGSPALIVRISLSFALSGVDKIATKHDVWWTFVRRNGHVYAAGDRDLATAGGLSWRGPWDFGPLAVVHGKSSLVLGHPTQTSALRTVAHTVDAAVPAVISVWGAEWSHDVAVLVPSSAAELAAAIGPGSSITADVAAVAESDGQDPVSGHVYGQRLVVEPGPLRRLSDVGRRIVIRHEITHIATAEATSGASPRWLVEGFADYVGNLGSGQPVGAAAAELRSDVRAGRGPKVLPSDAAFDTPSTAAQAYESSWLACRLIAAGAGQSGLVHFYHLVGASPEDSTAAVAAALRSVLHETAVRFVARWRTYLTAQLG